MLNKDIFDKNIVCHYTGKEAAISILRGKQINFSRLAACDDPRESKQWNFNFIGAEQRFCLENYPQVPNIFSSYIRNNSRVLCFCGWNGEELDFSKNMVPHYREAYYRTGFARSRMWSQYGIKHTGICLVFDKTRLEQEFESSFETNRKFYGSVEYQYYLESFVRARKINCRDILNYGIDKALGMQIDANFHEYFFLKSMDYRDEHEYRLVVIQNDGDLIGLSIESSLMAVIVGIDFPPEEYEQVDMIAQRCTSSVGRWFLSWQEGQPQLWHLSEVMKLRSLE